MQLGSTDLRRLPAFSARPIDVTVEPPCSYDSAAVTAQTIARMAALVGQAQSSPRVLAAVRAAVSNLPRGASRVAVCGAIYRWIQRSIRFVQDEELLTEMGQPDASELLIAPGALLGMSDPRGDCDDFSTLCASMLTAVGVPSEFVTIAADPADPSRFSHVYVYAQLEDGSRLAMDTSHGTGPGWEAPRRYAVQTWPILLAPPSEAQRRSPRLQGLGVYRAAGRSLEDSVLYGPGGRNGLQGMGDWMDLLGTAMNDATSILKPILTPVGTYTQNKDGISYRLPAGTTGMSPIVGSGSLSLSPTMLLIGGAVLVAVLLSKR